MEYQLQTESFSLVLRAMIFEADIEYPNNTILEVYLESDGFGAHTTIDIDIKEFASLIKNLYETLKGETKIKEPYGKQFIAFSVDSKGHILVSGLLHNNCKNGYYQSLQFENAFDQTYLKSFVSSFHCI